MSHLVKFIHCAAYITILPLARLLPPSAFSEDSPRPQDANSEPNVEPNADLALAGLAKYLPFVGLLIGFLLTLTALVLSHFATAPLLASSIIVIIWLTITGGLHFDGLMDTADGIFSHRGRERMLEIMHDSRVGNFAVMVGIAAFALKIAALAALLGSPGAHLTPAILLLSPSLARLAETWAIGHYPYARAEGKGKVWHDTTLFPRDLIIASTAPLVGLILLVVAYKFSLVFSAMLMPLLAYFAIATIIGAAVAAYLNKRVGGHTGDTYGAVVELSETISLAAFTIFFAH